MPLPVRLSPACIAILALLAGASSYCLADHYQHPSQKYDDHHAQKAGKGKVVHEHKMCFHCFLDHFKPVAPPLLPVIQSQGVRSVPPESDGLRMRLQVKPDATEPPRELFREPPRQEGREAPNPSQKDVPSQKAHFLLQSAEVPDAEQRFQRLERQMTILLDRLDRLVEQQAAQAARAE